MNPYVLILTLFVFLPVLHLILIGLGLIKSGGKIHEEAFGFNVGLTVEIILFLLSIYIIIPDGGVFAFFILTEFIGIITLILQWNYYKIAKNRTNQESVSILAVVWEIAIIVGLFYWIIKYIIEFNFLFIH